MTKIIIAVSISVIFIAAYFLYKFSYDGCINDTNAATKIMNDYLIENGKDIKQIVHDPRISSKCKISFIYETNEEKIAYTVGKHGKVYHFDLKNYKN